MWPWSHKNNRLVQETATQPRLHLSPIILNYPGAYCSECSHCRLKAREISEAYAKRHCAIKDCHAAVTYMAFDATRSYRFSFDLCDYHARNTEEVLKLLEREQLVRTQELP